MHIGNNRIFSAFPSMPIAMSVINVADGSLIEVNQAFEDLIGFTREESVGHTLGELGFLSADGLQRLLLSFDEQRDAVLDLDLVVKPKNGGVRQTSWSAAISEFDGRKQVMVVVRDLTEEVAGARALTRRYELLAQAQRIAGMGIWMWNVGAKRSFCSEKMYEIYGLASDDRGPSIPGFAGTVLQEDFSRFIHPDDRELVSRKLRQLIGSREPVAFQHRIVRTDGSIRWIYVDSFIVLERSDHIDTVYGLSQDVTQRVEAEEALREFAQKLSAIFDAIPDTVFVTRVADGVVVNVSENGADRSDWSRDDILGRQLVDFRFFQNDVDQSRFYSLLKKQQWVSSFEADVVILNNGVKRLQRASVSARIVDLNGEPHVISIWRDVTEIRRQEIALQNSFAERRAIEDSNRLLEKLGSIGREITGTLDAVAIFQLVESHVKSLDKSKMLWFYRVNEPGQELGLVFGDESDAARSMQLVPLAESKRHAAKCAVERQELVVSGDSKMVASLNDIPRSFCHMYLPLIGGGNLVGVMAVQSVRSNDFDERERLILRTICAYGAIALANVEARSQIAHSEKMASLGHLVASVAHEINTPIAAVKSSAESMTDAMNEMQKYGRSFELLDLPTRQLYARLIDHTSNRVSIMSSRETRVIVKDVIRRLEGEDIVDSERWAKLLVQLGAYSNVVDYLPLLRHPDHDLILSRAESIATLINGTMNVSMAVDRVAKIVFALKSFARVDINGAMVDAQLHQGMDTVLTIYQHQIKQGTELVCKYEDIAPVRCWPDELNQVWTNLIHNALQAMNYKGTLTVEIKHLGDEAVVSVGDTGCGIPEEVRARIFEPFFTTKPTGEGSGLGLDIVKKIVAKHRGRIEVKSKVGVGSTFLVYLPFAQLNDSV